MITILDALEDGADDDNNVATGALNYEDAVVLCDCKKPAGPVTGGADGAGSSSGTDSGHWALANLKLTRGECASGSGDAPCSSGRVLSIMDAFVTAAGETPAAGAKPTPALKSAVVRKAAAVLGCSAESSVVADPKFVRFAETKGMPAQALAAEAERVFKPAGPRDSTDLLSNYNIDETLQKWARSFPDLYTYDFSMMDFADTGDPFYTRDVAAILEGREVQKLGVGFPPVRRPAKCLACVLNTDVTGGFGKHWVAVFVDTRPATWSVEYFNSAGNPPPRAMVEWMERTRARLQEYRAQKAGADSKSAGAVQVVAVTSVVHQQGKTECGLYSLFYIRRRIEGTPYTFFMKTPIPDEAMVSFRKFVFRVA